MPVPTLPEIRLSGLAGEQPRAVRLLAAAYGHGRLPHGLLILGGPSTPRREVATFWVQRLVCQVPGDGRGIEAADACGSCADCVRWARGEHARVARCVGNERGSISVTQIRAACRALALRPADGGRAVLWIDDADGMAPPAQNALLKTLEEPPGDAVILLTAALRQKILPTIFSRVQTIQLTGPPVHTAIAALRQGGIDLPYAAYLAPYVGTDVAAAEAALAQDFPHVVERVHAALVMGIAHPQLLAICQELGAKGPKFDLTLVVLEVLLRDASALQAGADAAQATLPGTQGMLATLPSARLAAAIDALMRLRDRLHLNINRVQALEGLLLTLNHRG